MRTERQREAARLNGAKSRGPVTSEGKARSSRNSLRHGLYSTRRSARTQALSAELQELLSRNPPPRPPANRGFAARRGFLNATLQWIHDQTVILLGFETHLFNAEIEVLQHLHPGLSKASLPAHALNCLIRESTILNLIGSLEDNLWRLRENKLQELIRLEDAHRNGRLPSTFFCVERTRAMAAGCGLSEPGNAELTGADEKDAGNEPGAAPFPDHPPRQGAHSISWCISHEGAGARFGP